MKNLADGQEGPNSSFPQDIEVVTGNNVIKHVGENQFDDSFDIKTQYGVTCKYENGIITLNGTTNNQGFVTIKNDLLNRIGIGNHTLILEYLGGTQSNGSIRFSLGNSNMSALVDNDDRLFSIVSPGNSTSNIVQVKNFDKVKHLNRWGIWFNNNITFSNYKFRLYIVKGSYTSETIPPYEQYREEKFNLNFGNIELCKIDDFEDIVFKNVVGDENYNAELEDGALYKKECIGEINRSSNITWGSAKDNNSDKMRYNIINDNVLDIMPLTQVYSTHFNQKGNNRYFEANAINNPQSGNITMSLGDATTLADFVEWFNTNNVKIKYIKNNPTYIKITNPTLISQLEVLRKAKWFKGTNHWWTETENLEPVLKGTYKQSNNIKNAIKNKEQDDRLTNIESRLALLE